MTKSFREYLALVEDRLATADDQQNKTVVGGDDRKVASEPAHDNDTPGKNEPILPGVIEHSIRGWMNLFQEDIDPDQAKVDQAAADAVLEDDSDAEQGGTDTPSFVDRAVPKSIVG